MTPPATHQTTTMEANMALTTISRQRWYTQSVNSDRKGYGLKLSPSSNAEEDLIDEVAEDEGQAAERVERVIAIHSIARKPHELADQISYNAPYTDQRFYDVVTRKVTPTIQSKDKVCDKENTTNSSTGTRLSTWSTIFAEIMTWRTRPLDRVRQALNLYRGDS
jgi:hypothetical protein